MKITYRPSEGDVQTWDFKPRKTESAEAEAVEAATGWTWDEFGKEVIRGSIRARRALLWMLQRRTHPGLKFGDVAFVVDQFLAEFDVDELREMRKATESVKDEAIRDEALALLDAQIEGMDDPKAPSEESSTATG